MRRSRNGRLLADAAVSLLVTAALLVAIEITARFLVAPPPAPDAFRLVEGEDAVSQTLAYLDLNLAPLDKNVDFLWRNRPGVDKRQPMNPQPFGRHDEWTIVTNSRGFRGPEAEAAAAPPGTFHILCVGDSVTFGFNVDQSESYPERLQTALRARYPGRPIEVTNAGTPGWSWIQGVRFLQREGMALRPNLVIMAHGANDRFFPSKITDQERMGRLRGVMVRWTESARLVLERTATYRLVQRWFAPEPEGDPDLTPACRRQMVETGKCRRVALDEIEAAVSEAHRLARDAGAGLLVLNLDFEETDAVTAVRRAVQREHIPFLDLLPRFNERRVADETARALRLGLAAARTTPLLPGKPRRPRRVLFRVVVPPGSSVVTVRGLLLYVAQPSDFAGTLVDDGRGGDEVAGDGVWSVRLDLPLDGPLFYQFFRDGVPEFLALPPLPSGQGSRQRPAEGETIFPVEVFGSLGLMAERMHPNADGQRLIAESVLQVLPSVESFARWAGSDGTARTAERR